MASVRIFRNLKLNVPVKYFVVEKNKDCSRHSTRFSVMNRMKRGTRLKKAALNNSP